MELTIVMEISKKQSFRSFSSEVAERKKGIEMMTRGLTASKF